MELSRRCDAGDRVGFGDHLRPFESYTVFKTSDTLYKKYTDETHRRFMALSG